MCQKCLVSTCRGTAAHRGPGGAPFTCHGRWRDYAIRFSDKVSVLYCNHHQELLDAHWGTRAPCSGLHLLLSCIRRVCFCFLVFLPHPTGSLHPSISHPISWWLCLLMSRGAHWLLDHKASKDSATLAKPVARSQSSKWRRLRSSTINISGGQFSVGKKGGLGWDRKSAPFSFRPALGNDLLVPW